MLVACLGIASVATAIVSPLGLKERYEAIRRHQQLRAGVVASTEPEALIASSISDRDIFPERQTLTLRYLKSRREGLVPSRDQRVWDTIPEPMRFANVVGEIIDRGIPFYIVNDFGPEALALYDGALNVRGYELASAGRFTDGNIQLFRVVRSA
jgi:hypothetical protein